MPDASMMFPVKFTVSKVELVRVSPPVEFKLVTPSAMLEEILEVTVTVALVVPPVKV